MSYQHEVELESQLLAEDGIIDLTEEDLAGVTGGGLIKTAIKGIKKGAKAVGRKVVVPVGKGIANVVVPAAKGIAESGKELGKIIY